MYRADDWRVAWAIVSQPVHGDARVQGVKAPARAGRRCSRGGRHLLHDELIQPGSLPSLTVFSRYVALLPGALIASGSSNGSWVRPGQSRWRRSRRPGGGSWVL
jgi:hypothetical protein